MQINIKKTYRQIEMVLKFLERCFNRKIYILLCWFHWWRGDQIPFMGMIPFIRPVYIVNNKMVLKIKFLEQCFNKRYISYCANFIASEVTGYRSWVHDTVFNARWVYIVNNEMVLKLKFSERCFNKRIYILCRFHGGEVTGYHSWVHDNFYKASLH